MFKKFIILIIIKMDFFYTRIKSLKDWISFFSSAFYICILHIIILIDLIPIFIRLQTWHIILLGETRGQRRKRRVARKRHLADRPRLKDDDGDEDDLRLVAKIANNQIRYHDLNCPDHGRRRGGTLPTNLYRKSLNIPKLVCQTISSPFSAICFI